MPDTNNDYLERVKKLNEKFTKERNISSAPTTESTSSIVGITPTSTSIISTGIWDSQIAPIIKLNKWESNFDEASNPNVAGLKYVLNGDYEPFSNQLTKESGKLYDDFKTAANNFKNNLLKISKGEKVSNDELSKSNLDWQVKFQDFKSNLIRPSDNEPGIDPTTNKLIDYKTYLKKSTEPFIEDKFDISTTVDFKKSNKEGARTNPDAAYQKLVDWETGYRDDIYNSVEPVLNSWVNTGLNYLSTSTDNTAYRNNIYALVNSTLEHIDKWGLDSKNLDNSTRYEKTASDLKDLLKNKSFDEQIEIIKQNKSDIKQLVENMGYFGKINVFNSNLSKIGKENIYYEQDKNLEDKVNLAKFSIQNFGNYKQEVSLYKDKLKEYAMNNWNDKDLGSQKSPLFNALINKYGDVNSLEEFKNIIKSMPPVEEKVVMGGETDEFGRQIGPGKTEYVKKTPYAQWLASKESRFFNFLPEMGVQSSIDNQLADIYENTFKHYKQTVDEISPDVLSKKYQNGLYRTGLGDVISPALTFKGVDLSLDNNNNLKNVRTNSKQENISKIFNLINNGGNINKTDIALFNENEITKGLNSFDIEDFNNQKNNNKKRFDEFFGRNEPLDFSKMSFERYSNVPGHAYYEFEAPSGKKLGMIIPHAKLESVSEELYIRTKENPIDRAFHFTGEYIFPDVVDQQAGNYPIIRNRRIDLDKDRNNIISFEYKSDDGKWNVQTINAGHTSGTTIENTKAIMNSITKQIINKELNK